MATKLKGAVIEMTKQTKVDKEVAEERKVAEEEARRAAERRQQEEERRRMLAEALLDRTTGGGAEQTVPVDARTPSPFGEGAMAMLAKLERKVGNIFAFEAAEQGAAQIAEAQDDFRRFNKVIVGPREGELVGVRINICAEFNAINACFALGLVKMGARIKWASSDRHLQGSDDRAVMQALAVMTDGMIEPYEMKHTPREDPKLSYWTAVVRSLIWKARHEATVEHADFLIDPDGILSMVLNEAVAYELGGHRPPTEQQFNKEMQHVVKRLFTKLTKLNKIDLWQKVAANLKGVIVDTPLAMMRLKEQAVNGGQHLPLIDIHSSDCVEYAKSLNPLPSP